MLWLGIAGKFSILLKPCPKDLLRSLEFPCIVSTTAITIIFSDMKDYSAFSEKVIGFEILLGSMF